jgi:S-adenosylmethionine:diacylglycerol 3-amino-3-carboxypropyl transferase
MNPIVRQQMLIFNRYRYIGIPGTYLWAGKRFQIIGEGGYHIHRKADNKNSIPCETRQ